MHYEKREISSAVTRVPANRTKSLEKIDLDKHVQLL
jgi:hypothetical protein